jgi:hypothetical protein
MNSEVRTALTLIEDCMHENRLEFLAELLVRLEREYIELARLSTDDNYQPNWTHTQVLDYLTYEQKG